MSDEEQRDSPRSETLTRLTSGYGAGDKMPLGGYAAIMAAFGAAAGAVLATAAATDHELPKRIGFRDVVLFGIATHKLTRIVTKDWVTAPIRAPFTHYEKSLGSGEVEEKSRGTGMQRAVGDLLTCQFCTGPWIAGALYAAFLFDRRIARLVAATFASVAVSDWLHQGYDEMRKSGRAPVASPNSEAPPPTTPKRRSASKKGATPA